MGIRGSLSALIPEQNVDENFVKAYDASPWFQLESPDFFLNPGETRVVVAKLAVPNNAEPGGHYATIYFQSYVPMVTDLQTSAQLNARVGVIVLLTVRGDVQEKVVTAGAVKAPGVQFEAGPTNLQVGIRNEGNVHVLPSGSITVRNVFGKKVKELFIPLGHSMPGTTRTYRQEWEHGPRIGIYRVESSITFGSQRTTIHPKSKTIVLFPLVIVIPVFVALGLLVTLLFALKRRKRRRLIRQSATRSVATEAATKETEVAEETKETEVEDEPHQPQEPVDAPVKTTDDPDARRTK